MYNIGTTINIVDQSTIPAIEPVIAEPKEVTFLSLITSDKGPEDFMKVSGSDFYDYFGKNISYAKHGQPLLQASKIINAGGTLYVKRLVADDAKLANTLVQIGEVNSDTDTKDITITMRTSRASVDKISGIKKSCPLPSAAGSYYTLFCISDIGRGVSSKTFKINPEYSYSKNLNYIKYSATIKENGKELEKVLFNMNPDIVENEEINTIDNVLKESKQVRGIFFEDHYNALLEEIAAAVLSKVDLTKEDGSGEPFNDCIAQLKSSDILFGKGHKESEDLVLTIKYETINEKVGVNLIYESDVTPLNDDIGVSLFGGTNGNFTVFADETGNYEKMAAKFLDGEITDDIYDVDDHFIDLCVDANYPASVKDKIHKLADFRKDFFFIRDMGIASDLNNYTSIYNKLYEEKEVDGNTIPAPGAGYYVSDSSLYYNTIDPYTKKEITVTYGYKLSELLVNHMMNLRDKPVAGLLHNMVFDDAIKGTVNYIPMRKPDYSGTSVAIVDEREKMEDARINYAAYYDGVLTLNSQYTRNTTYSQLSYINNVLMVQQVIKAVRKQCPKSRFSFLTGQDLERYSEAVNRVLDDYRDNFASLTFEYTADPIMVANKIYNASIRVQFKDFVQSEIFTIFALPNA